MSLPSKLCTLDKLTSERRGAKVRVLGRCLDYDIDSAVLVLEHRGKTARCDVTLLASHVRIHIGRYYHVIGVVVATAASATQDEHNSIDRRSAATGPAPAARQDAMDVDAGVAPQQEDETSGCCLQATLLWHAGNLTDHDLDEYDRALRGRARLRV